MVRTWWRLFIDPQVHSTSPQTSQRDEDLALRVGRGDRDAFATLYARHFQGIYDFAVRTVRDREMAADVVQSAFASAWESLQKRADVKNVKAWLYAIARNAAIDELRVRRRLVPATALPLDESQTVLAEAASARAIDPEVAVIDREVVELVWTSAAALSPKEYTLLDLHVRRGLSAGELASNLGVRKGAVHTRLSRLKDSLEESVTSTLLMRRGRRDCPDLDALLSSLQATELTRAVRKAVQGHVRECDRCQESKRRYMSPAEILAGLAPV
ncbi:MAG: RNA polymerase sigma factor, partial [Actinomycetota bacterium]